MKTLFYSMQSKKVIKSVLCFLIVLSTQLNAQVYQWAHGFNSTYINGGRSYKVKIDGSLSDVYNIGVFNTNGTTGVDFDPSAGTNTLLTQANTVNGFISKYTSAGAASLALVFKGGINEVYDIAIDGSDNMYVTGYYTGNVDFDPAATSSFYLPNTTSDRIFIAKINANGTLGWCKGIGGSGNARGLSIALDGSSNVFVGGYFGNTTDFDPDGGVQTLVGNGQDGFLLKLSATNGTYVSAVKIGDTGLDQVTNIKIDNNGDLFACGYFSSATAFSGATYSGGLDGFIGKFSSTNLTTTWLKGFGGPQDDTPKEIAQNGLGAMFCTGYFLGTADFDPGAGVTSFTTPSVTDVDGFVSNFNSSTGNLTWAKQITGTGTQAPFGIGLDNIGYVHIAGYFQGVIDFNPGPAQALQSSSGTSEDIFKLLLTSSGSYFASQVIGGANNERCYGLVVEPNTGFYLLTGTLNDAAAVDFNTSTPVNNVQGDWYLAKYNGCINPGVPVSASSPTVCQGASATLTTAVGSFTTNWYSAVSSATTITTGSSLTTPTLSSNYVVYVANTNTCGTSARMPLTVYVDNNFLSATLSSTSICQGEKVVVTANGAVTYTFVAGGTSAGNTYTSSVYSNTGSGWTTTYSGTNANGCNQTASYVVAVKATPSVYMTNSFSGPFCNNTVNTLTSTATGASTYTWMPGNLTTTVAVFSFPSTTGSYSISLTGTGANGCIKTFTLNNINVYNAPTINVNSGAICPGKTFTMTPNGASTYTYSSGSNTVSPSSTTSYSVMGTNSYGCISNNAAVATVSINPTPTIAVNSGSICAGKSFTIIPSGAQTYTISGGQTVVSPSSNSTYSVTGTSSLGCVGTNTAIASVVVQSNPTVSIAGSNTVCAGKTINLTANGASTYTWNTGAQTNTISPSISSNTNYTVTGAVGTCTSNAIKTVSVVANPTLTTSSPVNSICNGANVSINASGASTYLWMPGSLTNSVVSVSPTTTTIYTVTGTAVNGCTNTAVRSITVNATPTVNVNSGAICTGGTFTIIPSGTGVSFYNISGGSYVVSPASNSSYTLTGNSSQGCTNTAVSTVSVQTSLTVSIAGSNSVCAGSPINLTANGAATYTWSTGSTNYTIAPSPTSSTTYTVIGASGTCSSTAVKSVTVYITPNVTTTTSNSLLCTGNTAILTASGAITYNWLPGSLTGSSVTINPTSNTTYTVTGTNSSGCSDVSIITQSVSLCTGIESIVNNFPSLNFYPNPFNDIITIESELPVSKIILRDVLGKAVSTIEEINHEQQIHINTREFSEGIYFMTLYINNQYKTYKIIKK